MQQPYIPIYVSGASDDAVRVAAKHADVYMMWGEPLSFVQERIAQVNAAANGRPIRFSVGHSCDGLRSANA